jgi:starvation-inducible DNA-binding protein
MSTLGAYLETSRIKERELSDAKEMVNFILENHKIIIAQLRKTIDVASKSEDEGTVDMTASFLADIEKKSWMLDAWLNRAN